MEIPKGSKAMNIWVILGVLMTLISTFASFNLEKLGYKIAFGICSAIGFFTLGLLLYEILKFDKQKKIHKNDMDFADVEISSYDLNNPFATPTIKYEQLIFDRFKKMKDPSKRDFISYFIVEYFSKDSSLQARYRTDGVFETINKFRKYHGLYPSR